jgi:hypothetical protein
MVSAYLLASLLFSVLPDLERKVDESQEETESL